MDACQMYGHNKNAHESVQKKCQNTMLCFTSVGWFSNLKQHSACVQVPYLEAREVYIVDVVLRFTQIICRDDPQKVVTEGLSEISLPLILK